MKAEALAGLMRMECLLAPCGTYCGICPYYKEERTPQCSGCETKKGHPFWGECKLFICSKDREVEHCGLCQEFPCELFVNQYDPEHGQKSAFQRTGLLVYRKKVGNQKYVEMIKKIDEQEQDSR